MRFAIAYHDNGKRYLIRAELVEENIDTDLWKISPKARPDKFILLSSNRPESKRKKLGRDNFDWKIIESNVPVSEEHLKWIIHFLEARISYVGNPGLNIQDAFPLD